MKLLSKYKDVVYLISFILILSVVLIIKDHFNKIEQKEQQKLINDFIKMEFKGIIKDYERIPRGINIELHEKNIQLGIEGIALSDNISINDSIVKIKGNSDFYLYKRNHRNIIYDTVIIKSGY